MLVPTSINGTIDTENHTFVYDRPNIVKEMTKEVIVEKVNDFLIDEFEVEEEEMAPEADLKDALELDSLDFVDLVVAVESNFGVKLVGEDFVKVKTLQDFYDLIERKLT